jgi:succinate dehydrogenase / fumarate reductase, flavoprotein subunit
MVKFAKENRTAKPLPQDSVDRALARLARWDRKGGTETVADVESSLRKTMQTHCGVFRTAEVLTAGREKLREVSSRLERAVTRTTAKSSTPRVSKRSSWRI